MNSRAALLAVGVLLFHCMAAGQAGSEPASTIQQIPATVSDTHMSEMLRSEIKKAVVIGGDSLPSEEVGGSYQKETAGLIGGINEGSQMGTVHQEIGGINVNFPIPILTIPAAIFGGLSGATKRSSRSSGTH